MVYSLSDERCPSCGKKLVDADHMWFQCQECGHLLYSDEGIFLGLDAIEDDEDDVDWMEGYEDE